MTPPHGAREVVVFGDVEAALVAYLDQQLRERGERASAHTRIPARRPGRFVTVTRVGGTRTGLHLDTPTIACEAWASTPGEASRLAQLVRGLVHALPGRAVEGVRFARVAEFAGPANLPDPASRQARYTATYSISIRPTAAS